MKKSTFIFLCVAIFSLIFMIACMIIAIFLNTKLFYNLDYKERFDFEPAYIRNINVNLASDNINIYQSENNEQAYVNVTSNGKFFIYDGKKSVDVNLINDKLQIITVNNNVMPTGWQTITFDVYLPLKAYENVKINSDAGNIKIENLQAKSIDTVSTSGNVNFKNTLGYNNYINTNTGNIEYNSPEHTANDVRILSEKGDMIFKGSANLVNNLNHFGNTDFEILNYPREISLNTNKGNSKLTILNDTSFYLSCNTKNGNIKSNFDLGNIPKSTDGTPLSFGENPDKTSIIFNSISGNFDLIYK